MIDSLGPGGAERSLVELLPFLREARIDTMIVTLRHATEGYAAEAAAAGTEIYTLRARRAPNRVRELRRVIVAEHPDLVHTTLISSDVIGRLAARGTDARVLTSLVNTSYDPVRHKDPGVRTWRLRAVRAVDGWTARHLTDHFHAITHAVSDAARAALGIRGDRITVVERGRDFKRLGLMSPERRASARAALSLYDGDEVLVAVGRQEWQKGHHVLLEALSELIARRPRVVLVVAGRVGTMTPMLEEQVERLGVGRHVRFLGHRDDLPEVLAASDVFVFPSLYEGLGGSVIEAMALALPVVASDLPALREVVVPGVSALLVPANNAASLARALETVLSDAELAGRLGARGRELFINQFTIEACAPRMIDLYRRVIS